jgi:hypothetical protein
MKSQFTSKVTMFQQRLACQEAIVMWLLDRDFSLKGSLKHIYGQLLKQFVMLFFLL